MKKRSREFRVIVLLAFITVVVFSALFIGKGITGMVIMGDNIKPLCTQDSECENEEVCCYFYAETSGVCNIGDLCDDIIEITKNNEYYDSDLHEQVKKSKEKQSTFFQVFMGIIMLLFAIFLFYIVLHDEDDEPVRRSKKRKK